MTDRLEGFTVVLERPLREDDAQRIQELLGSVKGVQQVVPVKMDGPSGIERLRALTDAQRAVHEAFDKLRA